MTGYVVFLKRVMKVSYLAIVGLSKKTAQILPVVRGDFRVCLISVS